MDQYICQSGTFIRSSKFLYMHGAIYMNGVPLWTVQLAINCSLFRHRRHAVTESYFKEIPLYKSSRDSWVYRPVMCDWICKKGVFHPHPIYQLWPFITSDWNWLEIWSIVNTNIAWKLEKFQFRVLFDNPIANS